MRGGFGFLPIVALWTSQVAECLARFPAASSTKIHCSIIVPFASQSRSAHFSENQAAPLSNASGWWDNTLRKRSPWYKGVREPGWLNNSRETGSVGSQLGLVQLQIGGGEVEARPSDRVRTLCEEGQLDRALDVLLHMDLYGTVPSVDMYSCLLRACSRKKALAQAKRVQAHLARSGFATRFLGEFVVSTLVDCGGLDDAVQAFHRLQLRTVFSWTSVISGYARAGQSQNALKMYNCMRKQGVEPDKYTFVALIRACGSLGDLEEGKRIHLAAAKCRCASDLFVGTCLVDMYGRCGSIVDAQRVFDGLPQRSVVTWTVLLTAYAQLEEPGKALQIYEEMQGAELSPNDRTLVCALQACGMLAEKEEGVEVEGRLTKPKSLEKGKGVHADAHRRGHVSDVFVGNSLVSMYGKCGSIVDAQEVFEALSQRDVVSWNAMLSAYAQQGQVEKALQLYGRMVEEGAFWNVRTIVSALQACGMLAEKEGGVWLDGQFMKAKSLEIGKTIHAEAKRKGFDASVFIGSTLISMYGKSRDIVNAQTVFDGLQERNVVAWTALVAAYVEHGQGENALKVYRKMQDEGVSPNEITVVCMLQACGDTGSLDVCRQIHHTKVSTANGLSTVAANTLIHAYGSCGSMVDAQTVFAALSKPDVVSWTALLAGYAREGNYSACIQLYEEMLLAAVKPNKVTFLSLLAACSHAGLVEEGVEYFESMSRDHCMSPEMEHYATMVDLLGRAGCFTEVENLLSTMPVEPDLSIWLSLLSACRNHGKVALGKQAFDAAVRLQPDDASAYLLLSNVYAYGGLWDSVKEVTESRVKGGGAWKKPGLSWIEHSQDMHTFMIGDSNHPWHTELRALLLQISLELLEQGDTESRWINLHWQALREGRSTVWAC